ncbi:MAG: 2-C-methyl-D-erythritol 4-phosphate cytidylyltransferase [Prolixibacteraceae bacterium]|jgi:2-C-methyl-D-erythritol 4-phosphate cytidylyltransferase|nr:2-C-methyl-D-erythritol 4-phosphate cytidylyltransferase [Prolixibacteraceae bacterium]NLO03721.1 2-C-methyl-D-erythritol 4-phosphate cytidylyltransferase [Bacteroidales bacterium]
MNKYALIVAGGTGSRMNSDIPKQFLELNGLPVLMHTIDAFHSYDKNIGLILTLPEKLSKRWEELCERYHFKIAHKIASGGQTRFHSVKNGLSLIDSEGIVFIHDGVRPLISRNTIEHCYETAVKKGNALPVIPLSESVREISEGNNKSADRNRFFLVQTPQTFRVSLIKNAYQKEYSENFTDDATVLESCGTPVNLVEGNRQNIKITYPEDLIVAEALLKNRIIP